MVFFSGSHFLPPFADGTTLIPFRCSWKEVSIQALLNRVVGGNQVWGGFKWLVVVGSLLSSGFIGRVCVKGSTTGLARQVNGV